MKKEQGFVFKKEKLNIKCDYEIFKVGNRVFLFDKIDYDNVFVSNFINILDLGLKFIPSYYFNSFQLFTFFLKILKQSLLMLIKDFLLVSGA